MRSLVASSNRCDDSGMRIAAAFLFALCIAAAPATKPKEAGKVINPRQDGVSHLSDVVASLPAEAAPANGAWDEFSLPKANKWLQQNAWGSSCDLSLKLKEAFIDRKADPNDPNETLGWAVTLVCTHDPIKSGKAAIGVRDVRLIIQGDEAMARAAKKWNKDEIMLLSGVIIRVEVSPEYGHRDPEKGKPDIRSWMELRLGQVNIKSVGKWIQPPPKP